MCHNCFPSVVNFIIKAVGINENFIAVDLRLPWGAKEGFRAVDKVEAERRNVLILVYSFEDILCESFVIICKILKE